MMTLQKSERPLFDDGCGFDKDADLTVVFLPPLP